MCQSRMMRAVTLLLVATIVLAASVSAEAADVSPGCTNSNIENPVIGIE